MDQNISRRSFVTGAAVAGAALSAASVAGVALADEPVNTNLGAGWLGEAPEIAESEIVETLETEILIVGAGCSGLVAGMHAAELGLDFILCEKLNTYGSAHADIGAINSKFQAELGLEMDAGRWLCEWARYASYKNDFAVGKVWVDHSGEFVEWLVDTYNKHSEEESTVTVDVENGGEGRAGGTIYYMPPECHHVSNKGFVNPNSNPERPMSLGHTGIQATIIEQDGYEIKYEYELVKLIREENGPVTGAIFEAPQGYVQINAKNIVLATGGYANNREMMEALNPAAVQAITSMNANPANVGQGIKAAMWIGAAKDLDPAEMLFDRGLVPPGINCGYQEDTGAFYRTGQHNLGSQPFLKVDRRGKRIANESANYDAICHAAANRPGGVWCILFDSSAAEDVNIFQTQGCSAGTWKRTLQPGTNPADAYAKEIEAGTIMMADTLEELGAKLGFEGEALDTFLATIARYNELCDLGFDADFGKEPYRLSRIDEPPYFGGWYGASILTTLDGLCINEHLQVLDWDEEPIEGLYAIGTTSGRYYSGNYPVYLVGNCLGRNMTFGYQVINEIVNK
ncbi:MAG: FAD-binding protein [Coriobacteriales bacterium]|nr:FAD-binding protein [Coriobacteriales bacterium]